MNQAHPLPDSRRADSNPPWSARQPIRASAAPTMPEVDAALGPIRAGIRDGARAAEGAQPGVCVLTGGQTGIDTIGAVAALGAGLVTHVVFPHGFRQEDGPLSDARRRRLRGAVLHELASADFAARTWSCVRLADAVVLIDPAGGEGCRETAFAAASLGRPILDLGPAAWPVSFAERRAAPADAPVGAAEIATWLRQADVSVLQIAGCRASLLTTAQLRSLHSQVKAVISGASTWHQELISDVGTTEM